MANCIGMEQSTKRYYPYGSLASSVIGFTGADDQGLSGLEQNYNDLLTGTPGRLITAKDAKSNSISDDYSTSIAAQDGDSLILTINQTIQYYLEKGLRETMEQYRSKGAYGVVMDCNTGAVLAMSSMPDYDCNEPYKLTYDKNKKAIKKIKDKTKKVRQRALPYKISGAILPCLTPMCPAPCSKPLLPALRWRKKW